MKEIERFEKLKELGYKYDPETGDLFGGRGFKIKSKDTDGYIICGVYDENRKLYRVKSHRFIWWLNHNEIPEEIDHINRIRDGNRLENLRNTTHSENTTNSRTQRSHRHVNHYQHQSHHKNDRTHLSHHCNHHHPASSATLKS